MSRKRSHGDLLNMHKLCAFCAGTNRSNTIEHIPGAAMFTNKFRPKGLEFPACKACNGSTRNSEQFLAVLGRLLRIPSFIDDDYDARITAVMNNCPNAMMEFVNGVDRTLTDECIATTMPEIKHTHLEIEKMAAKLGLAFYYMIKKKPLGYAGGVVSSWEQKTLITAFMPDLSRRLSGPYSYLAQGSKNTSDQFVWRIYGLPGIGLESQDTFNFAFLFFNSIYISVIVSERASIFDKTLYRIWKPGIKIVKGTEYNYPRSNQRSITREQIPEFISTPIRRSDYGRIYKLFRRNDPDFIPSGIFFNPKFR